MVDYTFAGIKVHNELEYCMVSDVNIRKQLERLFLNHRISYYEKWEDVSFFKRLFKDMGKSQCILCINEMQKEKAEEIIKQHPEIAAGLEMINKRVEKTYF